MSKLNRWLKSGKWKKTVRAIAPVLGTALGGPMAGAAIAQLGGSLLGNEKASEQEVAEAVMSASPNALLELRKADNEFKIAMAKMEVDLDEIAYKDRDSARGMFKVNIWPQITLSTVFIVGYFGILAALMGGYIRIPIEFKSEFSIMLGVLTAGVPTILAFWFGTSRSSAVKSEMIARNGHGG